MSPKPRFIGYVDVTPFAEAWLRRRAQASTVMVFDTVDPHRMMPFIRFIHRAYQSLKKPRIPRIYLYRGDKLFEVVVEENDVKYVPVAAVGSGSGIAAAIANVAGNVLRGLPNAVSYIETQMESGENIVAIFWGVFRHEANAGELYHLVKFLRSVIFDTMFYRKWHTVAIFTEQPLAVIGEDTLRHSIFVSVPSSTDEERKRLIETMAADIGVNVDEQRLQHLVDNTRGLTLHETETVVLESLFRHGDFDPAAVVQYKYEILRRAGLEIEEPKRGFESVGGYEVIKKFIMRRFIKPLRNPEKARKLGIEPPRGLLFFGPPGTGKTWFAKALAKELGLPFIKVSAADIFSKYVGESEQRLRRIITIAEELAPVVLFIDEIDQLGVRPEFDTDSGTTRRVFSIFLSWLGSEERKTIVVGTTNRPEMLDEAFVRVGRFDYIIPFLYPDMEARIEILRVHTSVVRKVPLAEDVDLQRVAAATELWTGAEIEELVKMAASYALEEDAEVVEMRHFERALRSFRTNMEERRQQLQRYLRLAERFVRDVEFLEQLKKSYSSEPRYKMALE